MSSNPLSNSISLPPSGSLLGLADKMKTESDLQAMQKQMRQKEAEFAKEKALLCQQVELLQLQVQEGNEREANQKRMNQ